MKNPRLRVKSVHFTAAGHAKFKRFMSHFAKSPASVNYDAIRDDILDVVGAQRADGETQTYSYILAAHHTDTGRWEELRLSADDVTIHWKPSADDEAL